MKIWDEKYVEVGVLDLYVNGQEAVLVRDEGRFYRARAYFEVNPEVLLVERKPLDEVKKEVEAWYAEKVRDRLATVERIVQNYKDQLEVLGVPASLDQQIQSAKNQGTKTEIGSLGKEKGQER